VTTATITAPKRLACATVVLAIAGTFLIGLLGTGRAQAATPQLPSFGVNYHATWTDYTDAERNTVVDRLAAAHVGWVRIDIGWQTIQERGPDDYESWYLDSVDHAVADANVHGLKVLGMLWRTPSWACGGCSNPYSPPSTPASYARFAAWAAERWAGKVQAWEVWNEPNQDGFWAGTDRQYVQLLKAAYPAVHAGDPAAKVVIGGPAYNDTNWLRTAYALGAKGSFDVMSTHPYQGRADDPPETADVSGDNIWLLSHAAAVHDLMVANGDGSKPVWFTEFGWSAHANGAHEEPWNTGVTPAQQGDYLVRALKYVGDQFPWVTNVFWYNERDTDLGSPQQDGYGLLTRSLQPKPAYAAVRAFLAGASQGGGSGEGSGNGATDDGSPCTIVGTPGNDVLRGSTGADVICGGAGNDRISGLGGDDVVRAGDGDDTVLGGPGDDAVSGGLGRDRVGGGAGADGLGALDHVAGNDSVSGGLGADRCVIDRGDALSAC
jgi:hypothetical protein